MKSSFFQEDQNGWTAEIAEFAENNTGILGDLGG